MTKLLGFKLRTRSRITAEIEVEEGAASFAAMGAK